MSEDEKPTLSEIISSLPMAYAIEFRRLKYTVICRVISPRGDPGGWYFGDTPEEAARQAVARLVRDA